MPVLSPSHLLEQAERLIALPDGGAPRQADLRRAISNAYYAVFHEIVAQAADDFVGKKYRAEPLYALVYRSVGHASLRKLCEVANKNPLPPTYSKYFTKDGFWQDLLALGIAVVDLQEKRHSADYDPLFRVSMTDAILAITTGRLALERFRKTNKTARKAFTLLLVIPPR